MGKFLSTESIARLEAVMSIGLRFIGGLAAAAAVFAVTSPSGATFAAAKVRSHLAPASCNVKKDRPSYHGRPPTWRVPAGGSETVVVTGGFKKCTIRWPNGALAMVAEQTSRGVVFHEAYYNRLGQEYTSIDGLIGTGTDAPRLQTPREPVCDDAENPTSEKWVAGELPVDWSTVTQNEIDTDPVPGYLDAPLTLTNERNAHTEWTANQTNCSPGDSSSFSTSYQGNYNGCSICWQNDGRSLLMWGNVDSLCSSSDIGCEQNYYDPQTGSIIDGDIMLDTDAAGSSQSQPWTNGAVAHKYDIWSIVAHEVGHLAGFGHVTNQYNVMWPSQNTDNIDKRLLGLGDAKENNAKY